MIHSREALIQALKNYATPYSVEKEYATHFLNLLKDSRCFFRDHLPGHLTGSSWIIDGTREFTLLTHHAKLNKWLQPGGHADGDEDILNVALREAEEETGLKSLKLLQNGIFDIDIHTIPARKDFPEHFHYDVRFLFEASSDEKFIISEESHNLGWVNLNEISTITDQNDSMIRMKEKVLLLR